MSAPAPQTPKLSAAAAADVKRILDAEARRLLAEKQTANESKR
jgi:hypothetical protein